MTVGITGRSGCGKSSVTRYLAQQGYPCIDADLVAREVLLPGSPCLALLQERFGADILEKDGTLKRRLLADRAFATKDGTETLNAITHPEIFRRIREHLRAAEQKGARLAFVDGAVIIGTPFEALCDRMVLVVAPYETSVQRICNRDGISPEMARRRLDAQTPENALRAAADHLIENDGTPEQLIQRCSAVLDALQKEAYGKT